MFLTPSQLRRLLRNVVANKREQGHVVVGLEERLASLPDSHDALLAFAGELPDLPLREDWAYVEPNDLASIEAEMDPSRPIGPIREVDLDDASRRVEAAFLASVCGCVLGKPLEISPTLAELRAAFEKIGEWPLNDYVSERVKTEGGLRTLHESAWETCRENIRWAAPDDDINYTLMGMLLLEQHGLSFSQADLRGQWLRQLPPLWTWGPERMLLLRAGADTLAEKTDDFETWVSTLNPGDELCGAMIRADAYGYACPGNPSLAAELAHRDASWTHRRTGIYGTMYAAAAIATAFVADDPLEIFDVALKFVPRRSRFYAMVSAAFADVASAKDWSDGYERIHARLGDYGHCRIYQEAATLINTLRFAKDVGHGICLQVMQGNDTDSYGATAGSILGAYFGPGRLEDRWLRPFNDEIHTTLANFHEQKLSRLAKRVGELPRRVAAR